MSIQMFVSHFCTHLNDLYNNTFICYCILKGETIDDIPDAVIQDCAQLVKANSIQGIFFFIKRMFFFIVICIIGIIVAEIYRSIHSIHHTVKYIELFTHPPNSKIVELFTLSTSQ